MRTLLAVAMWSVLVSYTGVTRADCLSEVKQLEQRLSREPRAEGSNKSGAMPEKTGADTGITVKERGGTTKYPEGGAAQPAESWLGSPPQQGQQVEERLATARRFADQGDDAACRRELEKARQGSSK